MTNKPTSVFKKLYKDVWAHTWHGTIHVDTLTGGVPSDPKIIEGWLRTKTAFKDDLIREMIAEVMAEQNKTVEEATEIIAKQQHLNVFRRDENGLYIEGRQLKAAIKEAVSVAIGSGTLEKQGWGKTNKWITSFVAEHIHVVEPKLHIGRNEADGIIQRFIHSFQGNAIQYEEYVEGVDISFTIVSDYDFDDKTWATIWLTGELQGIGASRSQGSGRYTVTRWEKE